jgi:hypothetical protein
VARPETIGTAGDDGFPGLRTKAHARNDAGPVGTIRQKSRPPAGRPFDLTRLSS